MAAKEAILNTIVVGLWGGALLLYGAFWLWYVGIPRPLAPSEIDAHLAIVARSGIPMEPGQLETLRAFLEADDGAEFFMLNLVRLQPGTVTGPGATEPQKAREVMDGYTKHFMPALFRRAGHPAYFGRAAGGYLERWKVDADPGWSFGAAIRYRSRRDMIELVTDPRFANAHEFKRAAIATTLAFPTSPGFVVVGPKVWVGLALALIAALAQIGIGALRG
jgi:hypothetical protein